MLAQTQEYSATEKSLCHYQMFQVCWKELSMDVGQQLLDSCFMLLVRDKCGLHQSEDSICVPEILGSYIYLVELLIEFLVRRILGLTKLMTV